MIERHEGTLDAGRQGPAPGRRHEGKKAGIRERRAERRMPVILLSLVGIHSAGCQLIVHPFTDELANQAPVTTASVEGVRESGAAERMAVRSFAETERGWADGSFVHSPLYFEDPFEENGSEDGKFAWTAEDYLHIFYWRARFLLNTALFPVSAVVMPPWTVMRSDAELAKRCWGELHDAERESKRAERDSSDQPHAEAEDSPSK